MLEFYDIVTHTWPPENAPISFGMLGPYRAKTMFTSNVTRKQHQLFDKKTEHIIVRLSLFT